MGPWGELRPFDGITNCHESRKVLAIVEKYFDFSNTARGFGQRIRIVVDELSFESQSQSESGRTYVK